MFESKEEYFDYFSKIIKRLKEDTIIDGNELERIYTNITNFNDLSLQDIITYMLYCFEVIELTNKWKLKKLINYQYFLDNMENIYDEIFCTSNSTFNNKIIAVTSFGNIIEKTINYNIENELDSILQGYLKCIGEARKYKKDNNLLILRGNLYCQIYNSLKDNIDINETYDKYLKIIADIFDLDKYINSVKILLKEKISNDELSVINLNNYLLFNAYNNFTLEDEELRVVFRHLLVTYPNEFFDKKIFIYLIKMFVNKLIEKKKLKLNLEVVFHECEDTPDTLFLNYNKVDCNFINNFDILSNMCFRINTIKYEMEEKVDDFIRLLKTKDILINKKQKENKSILNYQAMIKYESVLEVDKYFDFNTNENLDKFINNLIIKQVKKVKKGKKSLEFKEKPLTNNEIFRNLYSSNDIKELLEYYPILELEYNADGNYKDISKLIEEKIDLLNRINKHSEESSDISAELKTYDMLLKYRDCDLYSLLNDYYNLFLLDSIDPNLIKEKEKILNDILPNLVKKKILLCGKISNAELEEIYKEYINPCIKKISQNRVNNKKFNNTKDFLNYEKSNSDNYFAVCKLQEIFEKSAL